MAINLVDEHKVTCIEDLFQLKHLLNHHQLLGLKFYEEFQQRIPREEVAEFEKIALKELNKLDPELKGTICGSYRRQAATCGDIDMLITHPKYTSRDKLPDFLDKLVNRLKKINFLTHDISWGEVQYHGVCKLNKENALHRRIDILWIPYDQFFFGLLYFTGSGFFNIQMRRIALEKGYTLNEHEIVPIDENVISILYNLLIFFF